jgi:hypothetical protein
VVLVQPLDILHSLSTGMIQHCVRTWPVR